MRNFIEIHVLQELPANNINRDDTGAPKEAVLGGTRRARVSSQAWKKAVRRQMRESITVNTVKLTKHQPQLVGEKVAAVLPGISEDVLIDGINDFFKSFSHKDRGIAGIKVKDYPKAGLPEPEYAVGQAALASSDEEIQVLADHAARYLSLDAALTKEEKAANVSEIASSLKDALAVAGNAYENALFGRMAASDNSYNVDAAVQFAHAVGTHALVPEVDFYTLFDDVEKDNSGATMIGDLEYNSSLLYRYANVDADALSETLKNSGKDEIVHIIGEFVDAFITSMPTGKQNTFFARALPNVVIVTIGGSQPFQLATQAFSRAVTGTDLVGDSSRKLVRALTSVSTKFGIKHDATFYLEADEEASALPSTVGTESASLEGLVESVRTVLNDRLV